jgi:DNA mismatch endonuclease (patch repair protein)
MADTLTKQQRSENMRRIRSTGMKPEMLVRKTVHALGYRFRLHGKGLPGKPDLIFRPKRKAIFVHGCFWHAHAAKGCPDRRAVKSNVGYWSHKLLRNKERDSQNKRALNKAGWRVLVIWECELRSREKLERRITTFLEKAQWP